MNEYEQHLIRLLRDALEGDIEAIIKEFNAYYLCTASPFIPFDSKFRVAIHDLAADLDLFEPKEEWRTDPSLYGHDELRRRIRQVLALVPSD